MTVVTLDQMTLAHALDNTRPGTQMAAASVDTDGTARIELLERTGDGWRNLTREGQHTTSLDMAARFDDVVVTRLPDKEGDR